MTSEIFSAEWADAWKRAIDNHAGYRAAAANWEGSLALEMREPSDATKIRAVFVDLWHGSCRGARVAAPGDLASAAFVLSGDMGTWRRVLHGEVAPLMAIMTGRLVLTRGSLAALIPYAMAAKALVDAASAVPARFPGEAAP